MGNSYKNMKNSKVPYGLADFLFLCRRDAVLLLPVVANPHTNGKFRGSDSLDFPFHDDEP